MNHSVSQTTGTCDSKAEQQTQELAVLQNDAAIEFLHEKIGFNAVKLEAYVNHMARQLTSNAYDGGNWFVKPINNGAFYLQLQDQRTFSVTWALNYFEAEMNADLLSISATIFALALLADQTESEELYSLHSQLSYYALNEHSERALFQALLD